MGSTAQLVMGLIFGAVGMGYFIYGRRQMNAMALLSGIGLCVFPYFISNIWLMLLIGAALGALPFVVDF